MAKLTIASLVTLMKTYIDEDMIGIDSTTYLANVDAETISKLAVKIGKQLMNDSVFTDRLPELDGEDLPFGTTIEEYFINLVQSVAYDGDGATTLAPKRADFANPYYTKALGRRTIPITVDDTKYQNAMLGENEFSGFMAMILKRLYDSYEMFKYWAKKQLIGEFINRVPANVTGTNEMIIERTAPSTTLELEAFIKEVKKRVVELSDFTSSKYNINNVLARSPELVLYVKGSDLLADIDVGVLAGAFNADKVAIPVTVKQLEDFGEIDTTGDGTDNNPGTWAILLDPRGVRLYSHQVTSTSQHNAQGEFTNYYLHHTPIGYVSNFTNVTIWKPAGQ